MRRGEPVHFELHSTDASSGVVVPMYTAGTETARTLASTEFLTVEQTLTVSAAGGDVRLYFGTSGTPATGSMAARGTVAANGGFVFPQPGCSIRRGVKGDSLWIVAPAGAVDVSGVGFITRA